jgi:hypothetical protein
MTLYCMNTGNRLHVFILATLCSALSSCASTNHLSLSVTRPAPVYLPATIKKVGIINRSIPSENNKKLAKVDEILSLEGKNLDKDGAAAAVNALYEEMSTFERFTDVKIVNNAHVKGSNSYQVPPTLPWETVDILCDKNDVDAIVSLSYYDTDSKIDYNVVKKQVVGPLGVKVPLIEHHATITTRIKTGWRIYDPSSRAVRDERTIDHLITSTGVGINPVRAANAVLGRKEAVEQTSSEIGSTYALNVLPQRTRVTRDYFVRGSDKFQIGKRRAQTGDWDGAAELWFEEVSNPKPEIAGRACYNMAIINEINGDLDSAMDWASRSYSDYGVKLGLTYLNILKRRSAEAAQLEQAAME